MRCVTEIRPAVANMQRHFTIIPLVAAVLRLN